MSPLDDFLGSIVLFGIGGPALVIAIVQGLKTLLELQGRQAIVCALIVSAFVVGASEAVTAFPWLVPYVRFVLGTVALTLLSTVGYSMAKRLGVSADNRNPPPPPPPPEPQIVVVQPIQPSTTVEPIIGVEEHE